MKKQFLHEAHNLQDKAKKPDYRDDIKVEGENYDRGGIEKNSPYSPLIRRGHFIVNLLPILKEEKVKLLDRLRCHVKFKVAGHVGTLPRLLKNPDVADIVKQRFEMTRQSVLRADLVYATQHPKKNRQIRTLDVKCFLALDESFQNPIVVDLFAFVLTPVPL